MKPRIIVEVSLPSGGLGGHVVSFVQTRRRREALQNTYYLSQVPSRVAHRFLNTDDAQDAVDSLTTCFPPQVKMIEL